MQQITKKEIRELSQIDIEYFAKWAKRKEERSRTFLSPVLIIAYRYSRLSPLINK